MDCFIISANTKVTELEVKELINKSATSFKQVSIIRDISVQQIATLAYHAQSALRVCILISQGKDVEHLSFHELDFFKDKSFGVEHIKILPDDIQSVEFAQIIGGQLQDESKAAVNLRNPDIKVISTNDDEFFVGIDVVGFDMGETTIQINGVSWFGEWFICILSCTSSRCIS